MFLKANEFIGDDYPSVSSIGSTPDRGTRIFFRVCLCHLLNDTSFIFIQQVYSIARMHTSHSNPSSIQDVCQMEHSDFFLKSNFCAIPEVVSGHSAGAVESSRTGIGIYFFQSMKVFGLTK